MSLRRLRTFFTDTILRREFASRHRPWVRWAVGQYRLLFYTARGLQAHGTIVRSAALTFYTLVSLVPVVAVIFAVMKGFGLTESAIDDLYRLFPRNPEIVDYLVRFAENALARTRGGVVAAVALATLFWAVIRVFGSIESAFDHIWEVKSSRNIARKWADYVAVVMIVPVLWIAANALGSYLRGIMPFDRPWIYALLARLASLAVIWAMFTLLYLIIPNARVRLHSALTAGIVAGTLFLAFQWGYVYLQRWMTSYNAIYGSFAALPLLLVWVQTSWQILLFGGELSFACQNAARFAEERETPLLSLAQRRRIMLAVVLVVAERFRRAAGASTLATIAERLALPVPIVDDLLRRLVRSGQLLETSTDDPDADAAYVPAYDFASTDLCTIAEAIDRAGEGAFALPPSPELARVDRELQRMHELLHRDDARRRITDLI